jgi:hypothetical protein
MRIINDNLDLTGSTVFPIGGAEHALQWQCNAKVISVLGYLV